jgi:hypothetical protein
MYEYRCDDRLKAKPEGTSPRIHWVVRGTGTCKDRDEKCIIDEVNRREVCECDVPWSLLRFFFVDDFITAEQKRPRIKNVTLKL